MKTTHLALALALLTGCSPSSHEVPGHGPSDSLRNEVGEAMHYSGRVDFDLSVGGIRADLEIHLAVDPGESDLAFLLNGALELSEVSGETVVAFDSEPMEPGADWNRVTVRLAPEPYQRWIDLRFVYAGSPAMPDNGINQITEGWVELSIDAAWHPVIADIDREFTTAIELGLPIDWVVISSGRTSRVDDGFLLDTHIRHADIAFVAAPGLEVAQSDGSSVYHRRAATDTVEAVLASAAACRSELDSRFGGAGRLPEGRFVITDRSEGGYARKNFIALTDVSDHSEERLTEFLCHELAHYWSSGAKPLTVDNWLNEGFAVLVAAQASRTFYGEENWEKTRAQWRERAADQPSIWTPDKLERRPYEVNYKKAPLALARLEEKVGSETFDRLVVRYMTDPIDDTPALLDALESEAGQEARNWFEGVLAGVEP